jgi:DNA phosphorothioation-associated putative methyltransferase
MRDGLLVQGSRLFDYGCGHGEDVRWLQERGFSASGWDPAFFPQNGQEQAEVVNLGYVLNVIESPEERGTALRGSWALAEQILIVSAQGPEAARGQKGSPFNDGIITGRGTFQKYYRQDELRSFIEDELCTQAFPASLGVFYVFKDGAAAQQYLASRYRRPAATPRKRLSEVRFEATRDLLEPFMATIVALGRLPERDEFPQSKVLDDEFGSFARAFALVKRVTGTEEWDRITKERAEDLLVYLALGRFQRRPPMQALPVGLQRDIRAFFGSYTKACRQADDLLFRAGNAEALDEACQQAAVGKLLPSALYVHRSALDSLGPLLRVYEGCARAYLGEVEGANVIKLHRNSGKVSYLVYPGFETDAHPALLRSVKLSLRTRELECFDYAANVNPPVLHRKEAFLPADHPLHARFAKLTQQEEQHGLLDDTATIGTREGWERRLAERGFVVRGHRLVRRREPNHESDESNE